MAGRRARGLARAAGAIAAGVVLGAGAWVGEHSLAGARSGRPPAARAQTADPFASAAMARLLGARRGNIAAGVYDVRRGRTWLFHGEDHEQTGSIVKVDILATLLHAEQDEGETLSSDEEELATGMIEASDNDDANELWAQDGGAAGVGAFDARIGMIHTHPNLEGYWGETPTTARDQLVLLRRVFMRNGVLSAASRSYIRELMENVEAFEDWGVSAGPPAGVSVALKNGWVPIAGDDWQVNSIGRVKGDGQDYLIAILTNHDHGEQYGIDTVEAVSRIVWHTLAAGRVAAARRL
ncbi:MAG TPA: serine hydrolase [Solirubrobacteraceae bacterium]|nr:serine hydrolase [Solirubrobacteraceae bacterium]